MPNISKQKQQQEQQNYRLGLDLGTNSIGWAMLALNQEDQPYKILDAGVRIFSDGRNPKTKEPLAVARRTARGMRRRRDRFLARKSKLMNCLVNLELMPKDEIERKKLELLNPYELRTKALYQSLKHFELGRAIFHLNQRRGFQSNRKEQVADEKKLSETKQNQEDLAKKIVETNSKTLGEFFYKERILKELTTRAKPDESWLCPTRAMYESEFDEIKKAQFSSQKISEENWQKIREIIFDQRPLAPQEKGVCQFINKFNFLPDWAAEIFKNYLNANDKNSKAKGLPRAYLALPSYQKFRILSDVNNLKIVENNSEEILLNAAQKKKLVEYLHENKSAKFSSLRRQIGFAADEFKFNFEGGKRDKFDGNSTEIFLKDKKYFGEKWHDFSLEMQDEIVEFLLDSEDENAIYEKAVNAWQLSEEQALEIKKITPNNFKSGVGNLSKEFLQKLCAEIAQKNCRYDEATKNLGFHHSQKEAGKIQSQLDYYGKAIQASTVPVKYGAQEEIDFGRIANPTVHVALNQLRKVVNAIIKENGNPSEITIELARDLKISQDEKREIESAQKKNEENNKKFGEELNSLNPPQRNNYENRLKLKLFYELEKANNGVACCPYTGKPINITNLFSFDVEIEHILPFAKTYDDSIANKTLAYRAENHKKGNRSPFEAFGDATFERIKNLPNNKKWRFYENAMEKFKDENTFQASQLNDTRYLSKIAKQYLAQICHPNKIKVANGKLTSLLRHHWGLDSILAKIDQKTGEVLKGKNRDDHRHHAVDAIVIGMTETRLLQQISRDNSRGHDLDRLVINLPSHWNRFREDAVEAIEKIIVSHKPDHGKNSQLHEENYYGVLTQYESIEKNGKLDKGYNLVYRKALSALSKKEIEQIRDIRIRESLEQKLAEITDKTDKKVREKICNDFEIETKGRKSKIRRVRILKKDKSIISIFHKQKVLNKDKSQLEEINHLKAAAPGSNHHIAFWQMPKNVSDFSKLKNNSWLSKDKSLAATGVSFYDYNSKSSNDLKPHPAAKLVTKIHNGDLVCLNHNGKKVIAKVTSLRPSNSIIALVEHNESGNLAKREKEKELKPIYLSFSKVAEKEFRKIFVTPTGRVFDSGAILKTTKENK
jgi:CRISPR-associated endonuclease Csn1